MSTPELSLFDHDERLRMCYKHVTDARSAFRHLGQCYNSENHEAYEYWWSCVFRAHQAALAAIEEVLVDGKL